MTTENRSLRIYLVNDSYYSFIMPFFACFAIGCGAGGCRAGQDAIIHELSARMSALSDSGNRSVQGYTILEVRQADDSLNESSSATIRLRNGKRYKLVIYDDCYSKWYHLDA